MQGRVIKERYRIDKAIGRGGMAMVYKAFDMVLFRPVAIKILHARFAHNAHFIERFKREAHSAASLVHRNITTIYDTGHADGVYFIVMEFVNGKTLKQIIDERGPLSITEAVDVARQVVEALDHANSRGIIHRDIKPQNILITEDKIVKVTDFGIARALAMPGLTQTGKILGTARYISPEQARGQQADQRSDIYALGVILYEMVTGRAPFEGSSSVEVAGKHITETPVRAREINPNVPAALEIIIDKLLKKDPADRYQKVSTLLSDLAFWDSQEKRDLLLSNLPKRAELRRKKTPGRRRLTLFAKMLITLSLISTVVLGFYLTGNESEEVIGKNSDEAVVESRVEKERVGVIAPLEAVDYDPGGNGDENPDQVGRIFDEDESSAWSTEGYRTPTFGGLKEGVGVYIDYGENTELQEMVIISSGGWGGAIKGSDDVLNWATLKEIKNADKKLSVRIDKGAYRYYLIWITDLPRDGSSGYRCKIYEVKAHGKVY